MKQAILLTLMLLGGTAASLADPFFAIVPYYVLSILKPQDLWAYALPDLHWSLIAGGCAAIGAFVNLPQIVTGLRWNAVASAVMVFATLVLLSCVGAYHSDIAMSWGSEYLKIFAMVLLATLVIREPGHLRWVAGLVLGVLAYLAIDFNLRHFLDNNLYIYRHGHGGLDNNGTGLLLAMGIPFAYAFAASVRRGWLWPLCGAIALAMAHCVMISYSRGAMLSGIAGALWLLLHHRPRQYAILAGGAAVVIASLLISPEVSERFATLRNYRTDETAVLRFQSWNAAWRIASDHPMLGVGVRNANTFSQNYGADVYGRTIHNQYLQIAADCGLPALGVYLAACALMFWATRRTRRLVRRAGPDLPADTAHALTAISLGVEASMVCFLVGSVFLSLETFELPWLLLIVGGAMPGIARQAIAAASAPADSATPATTAALAPPPAPTPSAAPIADPLAAIFRHLETAR